MRKIWFIRRSKHAATPLYALKFALCHDLHNSWNPGMFATYINH